MIHLLWPWLLLLLPLPWIVRRFLPTASSKSEAALRLPFYQEMVAMGPAPSTTTNKSNRPHIGGIAVWILLVIAITRPQWTGEAIALPLSGRDLMLAVDISGSMEIPDFNLNGQEVTRLTVVKSTASDFIKQRVGDHIGLILFGSRAYLQTPLTFDRHTVQAMLDDATIGLAGKETAIGDAIGLAVKRLRDRPEGQRVLVLLTDGANTAGVVDPIKAATLAAELGLRIYTIGIGADQMRVSVPTLLGSQMINPSRDLDEASLSKIAEITRGKYFRAKDTQGMKKIYDQLDDMEPLDSDTQYFRPIRSLYHWPLGLALLISALVAFQRSPSLKLARPSNKLASKEQHTA